MIEDELVERIKDVLLDAGGRSGIQFGKIELRFEMSFQDGKAVMFRRSEGPWERTERM